MWYKVKLEDTPKMHCMWCKVGMHDYMEMGDMTNNPGIKWLCEKCEPIFDKHFLPKLDRASYFEGFKAETNQAKQIKETKKQTDNGKDDDIMTTEEIIEQGKEASERYENENESTKTEAKPMEKKECWFWMNRKCKFGDRCKDKHPTQCTSMMKCGKCPDRRCNLAHPKVCKNLCNEGY